ncbi:LysR family transcriptional regulator [Gordonia sp. L191]|uniref:LysR family transcriptional regulator n=1 Tax=Gordonia sp. L191 TaxID=2982699 RepID=UPI0024BF874F|nr:LysR family transcriptional regulator [Gordonia sp. L191]WHU47091.1 LysR family transcriptional regulator [Gordonia sp. L191]
MDLVRHLRVFVAVAEEGHFGRAADRLAMTQPPVSQGLRRLENTLGLELILRTRQGAELTEAGAELLPRARLLVDDAKRFTDVARLLRDSAGDVRWGLPQHLDASIGTGVAYALRAHGRQHTVVDTSSALVQLVRSGALDVAIIEHPCVTEGLEVGPVTQLSRSVLVASDHPLTSARRPSLRMLRGLALSCPSRDDNPPAFDALIDRLRARGLDPEVLPFTTAAAQAAAVASGAAFALGSASTQSPFITAVTVTENDLAIRLRVVSRTDSVQDAADAVISAIWTLR